MQMPGEWVSGTGAAGAKPCCGSRLARCRLAGRPVGGRWEQMASSR